MMRSPVFKAAFPFQSDVLALPVVDIAAASEWYCKHFGMTEVQRTTEPVQSVAVEREGVRIGFAVNGGDATQDGAAILVRDIEALKSEFDDNGVNTSDIRTDDRDGNLYTVFFVVAPDGLCYYFHEPQSGE